MLFRNLVTLVFSFEKDGSKAVFKGNPASASHNPIIKPHKGQKGMSKKIMWDQGSLPSTKDNVLELLYDFLNQFLSGSYNGISFGSLYFYSCSLLLFPFGLKARIYM